MNIKHELLITLKLLLVGIIIFSIIYPLSVGIIGHIWSNKARGSLVAYDNEVVGSLIIGQEIESPNFFKSRPSSIRYDGNYSSSQNLAPNNPQLTERVKNSLVEISEKYLLNEDQIPADFVTESGSALDPHISPEAAYLQINYISKNTGISEEIIRSIIDQNIEKPLLGMFGQSRVNVLKLNISLKEVINK
ncbi:MAG: potassium-transporting ATPase subunit C [Halanaerobiales bacterium]|nr:potassium-transporting ATPase subunit C [Halanaerobiales bacterium]